MPSLAQPVGEIPAQDVNAKSGAASTSEEIDPPASAKSAKTEVTLEAEVEEDDLQVLEEQKKVPYNRFKEKVDEAKTLKQQIDSFKRQAEEDKRRAVEDAENRAAARIAREKDESVTLGMDPTEQRIQELVRELETNKSEIRQLRNETEHSKLASKIERLEAKYPEADSLAVMGWKHARPDSDLEELMEQSHNMNIDRAQNTVKKIIEHKKAKAKAAIPTREGGIRLKESERPKNLKEAKSMTQKLFEKMGGR